MKRAICAALAAMAVNAMATETITATGGAGGAGGSAFAGAGANAGAVAGAGASANGGAQTINGGGTRAFALGTSAAANARLCMYPTLMGAIQNQEDLCAVEQESAMLTAKVSERAGAMHLCSHQEMRTTILAVHGPKWCDGIPLRNDPRAPYFALSGWHGVAADAYGPNVRERPDPARVGAP